jgi:uncharacterized protein (UPF0332 family)
MTFNWNQYLGLSKHLIKKRMSGNEEACFRCSISRAYYSAFHKARLFIVENGMGELPDGPNIHKYIIDFYKSAESEDAQNVGVALDRLREARNRSDYDDDVVMKESHAQRYYSEADRIISTVSTLTPLSIVSLNGI